MPANLPSSAQALVPYTGYYPLSQVAGAFVTIGTNMTSTGVDVSYDATVTISIDGQNSTQYGWNDCAVEGNTLVISTATGIVASLNFSPAIAGMQLSGTIAGYTGEVQAVSPFAPVDFKVWYGTYYAQQKPTGQPPHYAFVPVLEVKEDAQGNPSVWWSPGSAPLKQVAAFQYDFSMFVIGFASGENASILFEMGTAAGWGRVAGNAAYGQLLVSIQQQVPVHNL